MTRDGTPENLLSLNVSAACSEPGSESGCSRRECDRGLRRSAVARASTHRGACWLHNGGGGADAGLGGNGGPGNRHPRWHAVPKVFPRLRPYPLLNVVTLNNLLDGHSGPDTGVGWGEDGLSGMTILRHCDGSVSCRQGCSALTGQLYPWRLEWLGRAPGAADLLL